MLHTKVVLAAATTIAGAAIVALQAVPAGLDHALIDEVLGGAVLTIIGGGLKVWSDQRSDQRAYRDDRAQHQLASGQLHDRLERLETRTEAAIRLEAEVRNMAARLASVDGVAQEVRNLSTDNHGVLQYLKGRADQADAGFARRHTDK